MQLYFGLKMQTSPFPKWIVNASLLCIITTKHLFSPQTQLKMPGPIKIKGTFLPPKHQCKTLTPYSLIDGLTPAVMPWPQFRSSTLNSDLFKNLLLAPLTVSRWLASSRPRNKFIWTAVFHPVNPSCLWSDIVRPRRQPFAALQANFSETVSCVGIFRCLFIHYERLEVIPAPADPWNFSPSAAPC